MESSSRRKQEEGVLFGKYEVGRLLGCGAFAKVYYARNLEKGGQSVAIKVISKKKIPNRYNMENIKREITIMQKLCHPNIIRLYEVLASKSKIYVVLEYAKGGELFVKVRKHHYFSEDLARKYFRKLISAVGYCHSQGVYHRDLKPENLLLDDKGELKVTDFGLSALHKYKHEQDMVLNHTLCGTPAYVSPEIIAKRGYHGSKVDIWSCGIVLFVITAFRLPFHDPNIMDMYRKIYRGEFKCPKWMSPNLKRLLYRLLDINPTTRITIDHIIRDPWFTTTPSSSSFSFHFDYSYSSDSDDDDDVNAYVSTTKEPAETSTIDAPIINAFDLIAFSPSLDLSPLFDPYFNPIEDGDKFVSGEAPPIIFDAIKDGVEPENCTFHLKKHTKHQHGGCWVADLRGPNSNFVATLEIRALSPYLVAVEVRKKAGDSEAYHQIWTNKVRPMLSPLVHNFDSASDPLPEQSSSIPSSPSDTPS